MPKPQLVLKMTTVYSLSYAIIYSYIYITASSKRILVYYTAFKLYRRAFNASANWQESFYLNSLSYHAS